MKAVVQRVLDANLKVDGNLISEIGKGLVVYLGVKKGDTQENAEFFAMAKNKLDVISSICDGKKRGGADASREEDLICEIKKIIVVPARIISIIVAPKK